MKKITSIIVLFLLTTLISKESFGQCPAVPACTKTAVSGTSYTLVPSDVLCISSNYNSGNLSINGGTVIVQSGGNLNSGASISMTTGTLNIASGGTLMNDVTPTLSSVINNCGTISGSRNFNSNVTLNNYSTNTIALKYGGNIVNNYAANATISFGTVDVTGGILNNYASNLKFSLTSSWNQGVTFNNAAGASMEITSVPGGAMPPGTVFNNSGNFTYTPVLNTTGATFNNALSGTLNFTSSGSANKPNITNNGNLNVSGTFYLAGGTTTNNGTMAFSSELRMDGGTLNLNKKSTTTVNTLYKNTGTINMDNHSLLNIIQNVTTWNGTPINLVSGCASIIASTTPSNVNINSNFLGNVNLNFCGSPPTQSGGCTNTPTSVTDNGSGAYRITGNFSCGSGLNTNQYILITGVTGGGNNLNGLWQVTRINATTFDLIGSAFVAGANISSATVVYDQSKLFLGTATYLGYSSCANPCTPLPIKLISFNAISTNDFINIIWKTIEEITNDYYTIERSSDGIHFTSIAKVFAIQKGSSIATYSEYDYSSLEATSYYRLKQTNFNGSYSYSNIVAVNTQNNQTDWMLYPNPSKDGNFTIKSNMNATDIISITITDVTGNVVRRFDISDYASEIQVSNLSSGLYIVRFQKINTIESKKIIAY
jgi:hypothetical protein